MALTKVGPAGIGSTPGTGYVIGDSFLHSTGLNATNAYYTGIVTSQNIRVLGDLQVDGTTTTLDTEVTSVDKLEVAANNTTVGVAITQSGSGDILNLYDGSTEVFSVADGGQVDVVGDIYLNSTDKKIYLTSDYDQYITANAVYNYLVFGTANQERLRINSAGNLGIGTDNPREKLDVSAGRIILDQDYQLTWANGTTNRARIYGDSGNNFIVENGSSNTERLRITSAGGVSICNAGTFNTTAGNETLYIQGEGHNGHGTGNTRSVFSIAGAISSNNNSAGLWIGARTNENTAVVGTRTASGNLAIETYNGGWGERLRITSAGLVGIGTDSPVRALDVRSGNSTDVVQFSNDSGNKVTFGVSSTQTSIDLLSSKSFRIRSGSDARFNIATDGNVGIGTNNPALRAHIFSTANADVALIESTQNFATLRFKSALNTSGPTIGIDGAGGLQLDQKDTSKYISFAIGSERLRITSTGEIQTKSRSAGVRRMILSGSPSNDAFNIEAHDGATGTSSGDVQGKFGLFYNDGSTLTNTANISFERGSGAADGAMAFVTNQTERLRITSDGSVGIGTDNPDMNLHLRSTEQNVVKWVSTNSDGPIIHYYNGSTQLGNVGNSKGVMSSSNLHFGIGSKSDLLFGTKPSGGGSTVERLRITSTGKIGINDTNPERAVDIRADNCMVQLEGTGGGGRQYSLCSTDNTTGASAGSAGSFVIYDDTSGTARLSITSDGNVGINCTPSANDLASGASFGIPKLHVLGNNSQSGAYELLARFQSGGDADNSGSTIVLNHANDRGLALQGGRSSGNKSFGAIKSIDNTGRLSNVMTFIGGSGQGVENIKFYTNGGSSGTNERMSINTHGTVHTGGSTEITQTTLTPDLITQAGVVSPMFYRPFSGMSGAPSTSGPGYVDFGTGGVRHNLTDPHLGASYGGAQFQGGLIGNYSQTFSNTASGTTREVMNWNRIRILFRGLCLSSGHSVSTVKFRYSTYHYSNGWQDHSATEWSFSGTEQARGGRWVVGPWMNPSSVFTGWADVPAFGLYYNDNSSGRTFRIAGGVYFQFAHFI